MRSVVHNLLALGPLPAEDGATVERIHHFEEALAAISPPISDSEAEALVGLFGSDNCFGLSWTLLHLVETAPSWPIEACLNSTHSVWGQVLRDRALNSSCVHPNEVSSNTPLERSRD
jgi:hypothetical protein